MSQPVENLDEVFEYKKNERSKKLIIGVVNLKLFTNK